MNHLGPARNAEYMRDIARVAALDFIGVTRVIGDEPAADFDTVGITDYNTIAAREDAVDPSDAGRQKALSPAQRLHSASVEMHRAFQFQRSADPHFAGRQ